MLIVPEIYLGSNLLVRGVLEATPDGGLSDSTEEYQYCLANRLPYTPEEGHAIVPVGRKSYSWGSPKTIAFLLISESSLPASAQKAMFGLSSKYGASNPEAILEKAGIDVSDDEYPLVPVIPVQGVSSAALREDKTALLRFRLLLKDIGQALLSGSGSGGLGDLSEVPQGYRAAALSVALCAYVAENASRLRDPSIWDDWQNHSPARQVVPNGTKASVIRSIRALAREVWKHVANPDKRWVALQERTELLAGSINWKKRPNKREKEIRRTVETCRNVRLSQYKAVLEGMPGSRLCLVVSGAEVPSLCALVLQTLETHLASGGSPLSDVSGLLELLILYREVGPKHTKESSQDALVTAGEMLSATDWAAITRRTLKYRLHVLNILLGAGIQPDSSILGILDALAATPGDQLPDIPHEVSLALSRRA
jgi:hypothetical protein